MASGSALISELAGRYAVAIYQLADEAKSLDAVAADLRSLKSLIAESADLTKLVRSPLIGRELKQQAMAAVLDKAGADGLTRRFVGLVARNGRLYALAPMIDGFLAELSRRRGEVQASVVSARPLSEAQSDALGAAMHQAMGGKVAVDTSVDPALLGGLVVRVGSRMVDTSLRGKLQRLQLAMRGVQ